MLAVGRRTSVPLKRIGLIRMSSKRFVAFLLGQIAMLGVAASASSARAEYTMYIYQSGTDVVASGSGAINTAGISLFGNTGNFIPDTQPSVARILVGPGISTQWQGISGPTSFGPGGQAFATSVTGTVVGIVGVNGSIRLPQGYVSGTPMQATGTWSNRTLASLGLTNGTYTYTWGAGANADSLTLRIGAAPPAPPAPVPTMSEWAMILLGVLLAGGAALFISRRRAPGLRAG